MKDITVAWSLTFPPFSLALYLGMISLIGVSSETRVRLQNSSPAVMDSNVTFTAQLIGHKLANTSLYTYEWKDNAVFLHLPIDTFTIQGPATVSFSRQFTTVFPLNPGTFTMNVTVYAKDDKTEKKVIGSASSHFILTEHLNLKMELLQDLPVMPPPRVFATGEYITLKAMMLDIFSSAKMNYEWYLINGTETERTSWPIYKVRFCCQAQQVIGLTVNASINVSTILGRSAVTKTGHINQTIILKDPVTGLDFQGETSYKNGDVLQGNLSCKGSPPFELCVNVTSPDGENVQRCLPPDNSSFCLLPMMYKLPCAGNYTLKIVARNDVSVVKGQVVVKVEEPEPAHTPIVPIACIFIAVGFLASLGYAYNHDRRRIRESGYETADFNFHPGVRHWSSSATVEKLRRAVAGIAASARNAYQRRVAPLNRHVVYSDLSVNSDFDNEMI